MKGREAAAPAERRKRLREVRTVWESMMAGEHPHAGPASEAEKQGIGGAREGGVERRPCPLEGLGSMTEEFRWSGMFDLAKALSLIEHKARADRPGRTPLSPG